MLIAAMLLQCGGAALLALVLRHFHRIYDRKYLLLWSNSSWAAAVYLLVGAASLYFTGKLSANSPFRLLLTFVSLFSGYLQFLWLLLGSYLLATGRELSGKFLKIALTIAIAAALVSTLAFINAPMGTGARFLLGVGSHWLINGLAFLTGAYGIFYGWTRKKSLGRKITGAGFLLLGLYQMIFFSLAAIDVWFGTSLFARAHYALLLDFPLQSVIGLGLVIWFLEEEREKVVLASRALGESEERFRQMSENIGEVFFLSDARDHSIIYASPSYEKIWGRPVENLYRDARDWMEAIHPDDRARVESVFEEKGRGREEFFEEYRIIKPDGSVRWIRDLTRPLCNESGEVYRTLGFCQDVTARREAEEALRESEQRLRLAIDAAQINTWDWNLSTGRVASIGYPYAQYGIALASLAETADGFLDMVHSSDRQRLSRNIGRAIKEGGRFAEEFRIVLPDGSVRWRMSVGRAITDETGRSARMTGITQDITERKKAEVALRDSETLFRTLAETIPAGIYIYRGTSFIYVNEAAVAITGYSRDELMQMNIWEPFHPEIRESIRQRARARQRGEDEPTSYEARLLTKQGEERWIYITATLMSYQGEQAVLATTFDITERRRTEEALRASEERFFKAFNLSPHPMSIVSLQDGRYISINEASLRTTGYTRQEVINRSPGDIGLWVNNSDPARIRRAIREGGRVQNMELRFRTRSGEARDALFSAEVIDLEGKPCLLTTTTDITDRKRAERALRKSERRFRETLENIQLIALLLDADGRITFCNDYLLRLTGYERQEVTGRDWFEHFIPGEYEEVKKIFLEGIHSGYIISSYENPILTRSGELRHIAWSNTTLRDDRGKIIGTTSIGQDITDRKRVEEAMHRSELEYRNLFESANDAIVIFEPQDEIILEANNKACEIYGFTKDELLGMSLKRLSIDTTRGAKYIYQTLRDRSRANFETVHIRKDGVPIHMMVNGSAIEYGGRTAILSINRDITERKRVEEEQAELQAALKSSVVEWRQTFDAIRLPIVMLDFQSRVKRLNRIAKEIIAKDYETIIGENIASVSEREPWQKAAELVGLLHEAQRQLSCQVEDATAGRIWDITANRVSMFEGGEVIIVVARDITTLVELQESLRRNETMAAMGSLVAGVAHEVRNPLFGISATLDAFESQFGRRAEYQNYLEVLRGETERLNNLMRELLEYGKPRNLELSSASIPDAVIKAVDSCLGLASRSQVRIENMVDHRLPPALIDDERMVQVFQNLIDNAIQHTPAGGRVRIEAREASQGSDRWIECRVSDSGPGFREEDLPNIFRPFFTRRRGGTGLGLSIVQRIVEEHGGSVTAGNGEEGGAMVEVRLKSLVE
jgi:PAS domain S-box-containing protein